MKTNDPIARKRMKWIGMILLAVVAALGFSYLYTRGVSPVWRVPRRYTRVFHPDGQHERSAVQTLCSLRLCVRYKVVRVRQVQNPR